MNNQTLVILPGWGGSTKTWQKFIDQATPLFTRVVCIDLPGFGDCPSPTTVWGVEDYAEFVQKKIKLLVPQGSVVLLGHSFGGQVAVSLVAQSPSICQSLILSGAAVYRPKRTIKRTIFFLLAQFGKILFTLPLLRRLQGVAKKILYRAADSPDYLQTSAIQREIFQKVTRQDVSDKLSQISVPTLVVWGEKDSYVPLRFGKKIAKNIRNAKFAVINQARHGLHLTHPKILCQHIEVFIKQNSLYE